MDKYRFKFNKNINITYWLLIAILICGAIIDVALMIVSLLGETPAITAYIVSLVMLGLLIAVAIVFKACSYYKFGKAELYIVYCGMHKKISYDDIVYIRNSETQKLTLLYYRVYDKTGAEGLQYQALSVDRRLLQSFVEKLHEKNPHMVYEEFDNTGGEDNE